MKKNVLDLSSSEKKPNLSLGVKIKKIRNKDKSFIKKGSSLGVRPKMPKKRKIKSIRERINRANFSEKTDVNGIWNKRKDSSNFDRRSPNRGKFVGLLIMFLFILAGATIAGWYFFANKELNGDGVSVDIMGDDQVISGDGLELKIKYLNRERVKIKNLELRLNYPDGFYYISSEPKAMTLSSNVWRLEDLKPNESGEIILRIQAIGAINDVLKLEGSLSYEPSNFSSAFELNFEKDIIIQGELLELSMDAPEEIGNDNRVTYNIHYKNISDHPLENFRLRMEYPETFSIIETEGGAELYDENIWLLNKIGVDDAQGLDVKGFFDLEQVGSSTISAILEIKSLTPEIPLLDEENPNWYEYKRVEKTIQLSEIAANLKVLVNGKYQDSAINWGDELNYEIDYKNNSDRALENVSIEMHLDSKYIDWETLDDNFNGFLDEGSQTIIWDKRVIPSLSRLELEREGKIYFTIGVKNLIEEFLNKEEYKIESEVKLRADNLVADTEEEVINSNLVINRINSPIEFKTIARYYDDLGQEVGSGPLPPVIGETTSYQIVWNVKSLINDLNNVLIKTTLPPGIEWGQGITADGQNLIFNTDTRQIVWQIDNLKKNQENMAKFNILVTPGEGQVGQILTLTNTTMLLAHDDYSQGKINLNSNYLTTELEGDQKATGNGKVIDLGLE